MIRRGPQAVLLLRIAAGLLLFGVGACEPLRPEAPERPAQRQDGGLQQARTLIRDHASPKVISERLRTVLDNADEPEDAEAAARLLVKTHLEWYQLAHISHDLLRALPGHNRVYNTLRDELLRANGEEPPPSKDAGRKPRGPVPDGLQFVADLVGPGPGGVRGITVKRLLNARLSRLEGSSDAASRAFGTTGRLFLNLEAGWRYAKDFRTAPKRVRDVLGLLSRAEARGLSDNAWLMLQLSLKLSLNQPRIPTRNLAEASAIVVGEGFEPDHPPHRWLLDLGKGDGDTLHESLYSSWAALYRRVDEALARLSTAPSTDGRRTYERLARHLELVAPPEKATPAALHTFGEPVRDEVVTRWLEKKKLPLPKSGRTIGLMETALRGEWAQQPERRPAILVLAVLAMQHALGLKMADRVRGRALQLLDRGDYLRRSLILPGGRVSRAFPSNVQRCLEREAPQCLAELLDTLQKLATPPGPRRTQDGPRAESVRDKERRKKREKARKKRRSKRPAGAD